jgi:hypothetical protein
VEELPMQSGRYQHARKIGEIAASTNDSLTLAPDGLGGERFSYATTTQ